MKKFFTIFYVFMILILSCSLLFNLKNNNDSDGGSKTTFNVDYSQLTYCAFGDSITYGADYSRSYGQMDNPYCKLVKTTLGLKSSTNKGVSGATFVKTTGLNRDCITDIVLSTSERYDIISVLGGVNDYACSLPLGTLADTDNSTIYGSLNIIADYLTLNYSNSFVFFMTPYKAIINNNSCLTNNASGCTLQDISNAIKLVANNHNFPVLDLFNKGNYENIEMTQSSSDGIHPSQSFVQMYTAPQISKFIRDNYSK